jgi:signal transduction histidine kinase
MSEETLKKATEPFYMADKSRSGKSGGVGLGLPLCIEIAKIHNAQIDITSKPGSGTTVFVRISAEAAS